MTDQNEQTPAGKTVQELQSALQTCRDCHTDLKRRVTHLMRAIEQGPVGVLITDAQGRIEYVNPKFEQMTGYSAEEVLGRNPKFLRSGETDRSQYTELWQTILKGEQWTGVFHNRRKDGSLYWERAVISGVQDEQGTITHFVGVKEDISLQRELESRLEEEKLKFFHQSKMAEVGMLASGILHEVGNPIASIRGLVEESRSLLASDSPEDRQTVREYLDMVMSYTDRLMTITHEISDFTSPQGETLALVDLNALVRSTARLVKFDKRWRNISLTLELDPQLPAITAIKDQLSHVLLNLLVNAADAVEGSQGQGEITVRTASQGDHVCLMVADNGTGMSSEIQKHIFDAFYTTKPKGKGSGLGLSLVKSILDAHHGTIEVDSRMGQGTEFRIVLPVENNNIEQVI